MKKIDIITRAMTSGGAERVIAQLANFFVEKNIKCRIITTEEYEVMYELDKRIKVIPVGKKANSKVLDRIARYKVVRKTVLSERPDVVLTMPEDSGIYVILSLLGTGIPVYVSERNNPWVMPDVKITRFLRKIAYPFAKGVIFQTEMAKSFFSKFIQKKGVVIGNPVDATRIPVPYEGERKKVIVGAGRLEKQKNFSLLISAFAEFSKDVPGYELCIYGEGRLREQLEKEADILRIADKVLLPGRKNNLLELMNECSMFVLSSDYEGMPNVLIEAMCMGMPVISTDCPSGGPKELIQDHVNGLLIPVGDKTAMVAAMKECVEIKNQKRMAANAYKIKRKLAGEEIFEQWHEFLFRGL